MPSLFRQDPRVGRLIDMSCKGSGAKLMRLCLMRYGIDVDDLVIKRSLMRVFAAKNGYSIYSDRLEHDSFDS